MILGNPRVPFRRPAGASPSFQPKLPNTGYISHFHPLTAVTHAMDATSAYRPPLQAGAGPTMLPNVPAPVAAPVPKAGGTAGFSGGFGSTGGVQAGGGHMHVDPYMVVRGGFIPGVSPSGANIRAGVRNAGARIQRSMPFQTAPLAPIVAPVPAAPMVPAAAAVAPAPTAMKGFGLPRRRRGWFSRFISPETVHEQAACEEIGPRKDGLFVTICNGRVTQYRDAAGNVRNVG